MTRAPAPARRRRLFGSVRATHIALALLFGLAAAAAFALMARSSESALRAEIDAELRAISRQHALRGLISVGDFVDYTITTQWVAGIHNPMLPLSTCPTH